MKVEIIIACAIHTAETSMLSEKRRGKKEKRKWATGLILFAAKHWHGLSDCVGFLIFFFLGLLFQTPKMSLIIFSDLPSFFTAANRHRSLFTLLGEVERETFFSSSWENKIIQIDFAEFLTKNNIRYFSLSIPRSDWWADTFTLCNLPSIFAARGAEKKSSKFNIFPGSFARARCCCSTPPNPCVREIYIKNREAAAANKSLPIYLRWVSIKPRWCETLLSEAQRNAWMWLFASTLSTVACFFLSLSARLAYDIRSRLDVTHTCDGMKEVVIAGLADSLLFFCFALL